MLDKISLKSKILILCTLMASLSVLISFFSYTSLNKVDHSSSRIVEKSIPSVERINSLALIYREIRIELRTLGLPGVTAEAGKEIIKKVSSLIEQYEKDNQYFEKKEMFADEAVLYKTMDAEWVKFKNTGLKVFALYQTGKPEDMTEINRIFLVDCPIVAESYSKAQNNLITYEKKLLAQYSAESQAINDNAEKMFVIIPAVGLFIAFLISFLFANNAAKLSSMINEIAYSLRTSADEVSSAANQIASTSSDLSEATGTQQQSLQETSASIEEINSMIGANTQSAKQSALASENSLASAEKGQEVVTNMIKAIEDINLSNSQIMNQIDESNKEIEDIIKLISEIGNKTKVINDIVFQTKLLSFNASVEAARAGENGKGFAVVAEEVGNLAAMSGAAAIEISSMLDNSIHKVENIVKNSKDKVGKLVLEGKKNVDKGSLIANQCGEVLSEIVKSVASVSVSVSEISTASQEQAQGVHEVTKAIAQLDQVTQENTSNAVESAHAAANLSQQATTLTQLVEKLVQTVEGRKDTPVATSVNVTPKKESIHKENENVLSLKKATPASPAKSANKETKIAMIKTEKKVETDFINHQDQKKVVNGGVSFPAADDPRFSDV